MGCGPGPARGAHPGPGRRIPEEAGGGLRRPDRCIEQRAALRGRAASPAAGPRRNLRARRHHLNVLPVASLSWKCRRKSTCSRMCVSTPWSSNVGACSQGLFTRGWANCRRRCARVGSRCSRRARRLAPLGDPRVGVRASRTNEFSCPMRSRTVGGARLASGRRTWIFAISGAQLLRWASCWLCRGPHSPPATPGSWAASAWTR